MFWNISKICFFFFSMQIIKSNCYISFLNLFPIIFFWWKIYSFLFIFIYKRCNFCYSLWMFFLLLNDLTRSRVSKTFVIFFINGIYCNFFVLYPIRRIYHDSDLFYFIYNPISEHNQRQTHYISLIPNYFDIYFFSESKSYFRTCSLLSMISMLSLFECITSSL